MAIHKVGILFSGGPAPAANAVISSAVMAFRRGGCEVYGFRHGYASLVTEQGPTYDEDVFRFEDHHLRGLRNRRGVFLGTARDNPGKQIAGVADMERPEKRDLLRRVYTHLVNLDLDALISIGGDDTLRTANLVHLAQNSLPPEAPRVRIVHLPKTIDNDYRGIDFTFGFFTAVDVLAKELLNLREDAKATRRYFIVETMGRKAAWLAYGAAIAGEAHMVVGVEDVYGPLERDGHLDLDALTDRICDLIAIREAKGKRYGTVVLAEGLAERLPADQLSGLERDPHGHLSLSKLSLGKLMAERVKQRFKARTGRSCTTTGLQLGYESRCAPPHAFDVVLGCQLGQGAYRALVERGLDAHMVSVSGQMELQYVPFEALVDPITLRSEASFIQPGSDFHRLAHGVGTKLT